MPLQDNPNIIIWNSLHTGISKQTHKLACWRVNVKVLKLGAKCSSCIRTTKMDHQNGENLKSGTVIHEELSEHFLMQLK
jgi:hypothetical protein